jgi:hypothetical protein
VLGEKKTIRLALYVHAQEAVKLAKILHENSYCKAEMMRWRSPMEEAAETMSLM